MHILMITQTKLYAGFTSPWRLDHKIKGGGILAFTREEIPSKLITANLPNAEGFFL